jgi:hypothetical protein
MHSQNGAWENDESRNQGSNRVTEKTTLVIARLQSVMYKEMLVTQHLQLALRNNVKVQFV